VVRTDEPLDGLCSVYAESSLCELLDDFIEEQHLVAGIDGNLSVATAVQVVESTVTTAIDDLDELGDLDF
jgi:hypothetical protein